MGTTDVRMPDESTVFYECPRCRRPVEDDEDYVVALEYKLETGFALHMKRDDLAVSVPRRFHVGHFRGRIGQHFYELISGERGH